jgi:hypothetical protein
MPLHMPTITCMFLSMALMDIQFSQHHTQLSAYLHAFAYTTHYMHVPVNGLNGHSVFSASHCVSTAVDFQLHKG